MDQATSAPELLKDRFEFIKRYKKREYLRTFQDKTGKTQTKSNTKSEANGDNPVKHEQGSLWTGEKN